MEIKINERAYDYEFPVRETPHWAHKVERWYQMDAYAYGLVQSYFNLMEPFGQTPDLIFLASPEASNRTDYQFAKTAANSPSKFVHTLPNIRGSGLCQVMNWTGPLLCIQNDPATIQTALREGKDLVESGSWKRVWILGVTRTLLCNSLEGQYRVSWISLESQSMGSVPS